MNKKTYILAIDTTQPETGIGLLVNNQSVIKTWVSQHNQSDELLPNIGKLLKKQGIEPTQLNSVAVNLGPGSFTGLRVGISVANAFGYGLQIPVIGKANLTGNAQERIGQLLKLTANTKKFRQVLPEYGRPPRITIPVSKTGGRGRFDCTKIG